MKICLISNFPSHYREEIYRELGKDFNCDFVFGDKLNGGITPFDISTLNSKVHILKNISYKDITLWQIGVLKYAFKKYDRVIIADDIRCLSTWVFLLMARLSGKKIYFWAHGWYGKENYIKKCIKQLFYRLPEGMFLYGNYSRNLMIDNGFNPDKLWVIHNSLAYSRQIEIRRGLRSSGIYTSHFLNTDPNLIFIGRLTKVKRLDMLIRALDILRKEGLHCNLTLVGAGTELEELRRMTIDYELENRVWFYGASYDEYTNAELIYNADLCVSPGNIGLTAMHVMMYGTPAVTHDSFEWQMPEFEAIRPDCTGEFYNHDSITSLADTIKEWLESKKGMREEVRKSCYAEIDAYWNPAYQLDIIRKNINN